MSRIILKFVNEFGRKVFEKQESINLQDLLTSK
jgi:hypothetical protein